MDTLKTYCLAEGDDWIRKYIWCYVCKVCLIDPPPRETSQVCDTVSLYIHNTFNHTCEVCVCVCVCLCCQSRPESVTVKERITGRGGVRLWRQEGPTCCQKNRCALHSHNADENSLGVDGTDRSAMNRHDFLDSGEMQKWSELVPHVKSSERKIPTNDCFRPSTVTET